MDKQNITYIAVIIIGIIGISIGVKYTNGNHDYDDKPAMVSGSTTSNVSIVGGKQIIDLTIGPGYKPKFTTAKANIPTELRIKGNNAFGCESALRIAQLSYAKNFGPTDSDTIQIPPQKPGNNIKGNCSMGMYNFKIDFQ